MEMKKKVALTCALTGSGDSHLKHPNIPKSPEEIAAAAVEATKAGASIIHMHVRDPKTGAPCRDIELYQETVRLIRDADVDVCINITTGMGGDWTPDKNNPLMPGPGSDMITPAERMEHILRCRPEICTLDCGSINWGQNLLYIATYEQLRESARLIQGTGVTPEVEAFDLGFMWQANDLLKEGLLPNNTLFQLCVGIPYGVKSTTLAVVAMRDLVPQGHHWAGFGIGKEEFPMLALMYLMGGNVRVGLEDNIYISKGEFATNGLLVEKGKSIIESLGGEIMTPQEARKAFGLVKQKPQFR